MKRTIGIGIQNFDEIITENYFYIDKTYFIKEWWESGDSVTLITRPRRFGKTLNISMLEQFFSIKHTDKKHLFEHLSIWQEEKYRNLQGTYPVIKLSFADVKSTNYAAVKEEIYYLLVDLFEQHRFLLDSDLFSATEKELYRSINMNMSEVTAARAIQRLCSFLSRYYGKKVIVLLDEYDTPMLEAYIYGFWNEFVAFSRSIFNSTFKTNPFLFKGLMTGITRVSKESVFSDLNNLQIVTTTSDKYATSFGFTEAEVFTALEECNLENEKTGVKKWYNGFTFGKHTNIYNPWSILNFLDTGKYETYWANTSSNQLIGKLIREGNKQIKTTFESLLKGDSIRCAIDEQIVYNQLDDNEEAIWSLLLASGYLKITNYEPLELLDYTEEHIYEVALTNQEVLRMFYNMVRGWFKNTSGNYNDFVDAMLQGNIEEMNAYMNRVARDTFSYFDTGKHSGEPERFYHGFVLGLLADFSTNYIVTSNRESGFGRYDVIIEPKDQKKDAIILEFKVFHPNKEASLEDTVAAALKQIHDKQYESVLIQKGFSLEQIHKYGFAFDGKKVLIGE